MCGPPPTHHPASGMRDRTDIDAEQDPGETSWQAHGPTEPLQSVERRRRSPIEGGHRPYGIPLLSRAFDWPSPERDERPYRPQAQFSPGIEPPHTPAINAPGGPVSTLSHGDSRLVGSLHYPDTEYGRHRSAPLYSSEEWDRRMSFGQLPLPGTQPEGSSSRVVLPPVRHLLGELGMLPSDEYERGPLLPQLRLPDDPVAMAVPRVDEEESERTTDMTGTQPRGKRGRVEMGEEGEEKRVVRKIYVACDFCRGRKLRCDGGRPRCSNCETRSLACKYQEHPRRRGPGKAPKGSRAKKAGRKSAGDPDEAGPSGVP